MIISNNKPIRIIGYPESSMTQEFVNEISKTHSVQVVEPSVFLKENDKNQYQYIIAVSVDLDERKYLVKLASQLDLDLITVINDTDFKIRNSFEKWMNYMNKHEDNSGELDPAKYQRNMKVYQLGKAEINGNLTSSNQIRVLKQYEFYGTFPTSISAIDLSYDQADTIEEFTVDLQVQWWDALDGNNKTILGSGDQEKF